MRELYNKLFNIIVNKKSDREDLIYEAINLFLEHSDDMSMDEFFTIREFLRTLSSKNDLSVESLDAEKPVLTLDDLIIKLQIPKLSLKPTTFFKEEKHYNSSNALYDDFRLVLLNKDSFKTKHKDYIHNWCLMVARIVSDELEKMELEEDENLIQFKYLLHLIISGYSVEENAEHLSEIDERVNIQREKVTEASILVLFKKYMKGKRIEKITR